MDQRDRGKEAESKAATAKAERALPPVAAPSPSLPKGGGALRGLGEKLTINAASGTVTLQVPLALSPSRAGVQPELTLSYNSGAGTGPFGGGFHP